MRIVKTNKTLLALIPNVVTTVEGETPLIDKIEQWLLAAEDWVTNTFTGDTIMDDLDKAPSSEMWRHTASLVVCEALRNAIPSLDVVLTPNGFGIVSNSNVAPASKDRVERLINQMATQRDAFINLLLRDLRQREDWRETEQYAWFSSSLLQSPKACVAGAADRIREGKQWETFLQLRERAILIEDAIAEKWISPEVMTQLRAVLLNTGLQPTAHQVALKVRSCVFQELRGNPRNHWDLDRIVNFIRHNGDVFPAWETSETAKLYNEPTVFKNKKDSPGYFF